MRTYSFNPKGAAILAGVSLLFFGSFFNLLFLAIMLTTIYVHEMGHAVASKYIKLGVKEISVGVGPVVLKRQTPNEPDLILRSLPVGGYNITKGDISQKPYWHKMLLAAGGILANLAASLASSIGFLILWIAGGQGDVAIMESLSEHFSKMQQSETLMWSGLETTFLSTVLLFAAINLLFAAVQALPLLFFDGAKLVEYTTDRVMSKRRSTDWALHDNPKTTAGWFGVSVVFLLAWLIIGKT